MDNINIFFYFGICSETISIHFVHPQNPHTILLTDAPVIRSGDNDETEKIVHVKHTNSNCPSHKHS